MSHNAVLEAFLRRLLNLGPDDPIPKQEAPPEEPAAPSPQPAPTEPVTDPALVTWVVAHAYTPNEAATYGGGEHLQLLVPIHLGRVVRKRGDALCRPTKRRFWGLHEVDGEGRAVRCPRCLAMARRLGITGEALDLGEKMNAERVQTRFARRVP